MISKHKYNQPKINICCAFIGINVCWMHVHVCTCTNCTYMCSDQLTLRLLRIHIVWHDKIIFFYLVPFWGGICKLEIHILMINVKQHLK